MSTDLNPRESYGQLYFLDNTIESISGDINIQIGLTESAADLVLNRNVLLARGKTLSLEDHVAPHNRVALSMANGVLVVGTGGLGLRVGDIEIYQDTIESTAGNIDFKLGNPSSTANLVIGRNVVMANGKTIAPAGIKFDITHTHVGEDPGTLCWNPNDDTLNIQHTGGVNQQVGQELYARVKNVTGNTIANGSVVRFSGASGGRLEAAPFQADGTYPSLYTLGVSTQDIADDGQGLITVWGTIHDIDTTGGAENWAVGDILYASPTTAGGLTKVKPTAPNNVVPIAAVLTVSATVGEIFVRPTIEQKYSYGRFARTTDATVVSANTAYAVTFDTTTIANGVTVGSPASRLVVDQSGLYHISVNAQVEITGSPSSTGTMYIWLRKNGTDITNSMRRQGQRGEVPSLPFSYTTDITLAANDYVEVMYAADTTSMLFDATTATAFGPTTAAVLVSITQVQL